jgi:hypothetical protein
MNEVWQTIVFLLFFATWVALGVIAYLRDRKESAAIKRSQAVRRATFAGSLFVAFCFLMSGGDWRVLWVALPVVLILWLTLRNTKYCDKCNATLHNHNWSTSMLFCPKCGSKLEQAYPGNVPLE